MAYVEEIYSHGCDPWELDEEFRNLNTQSAPNPADLKRVAEGRLTEKRWFRAQFGVAKERFRKYLDISA